MAKGDKEYVEQFSAHSRESGNDTSNSSPLIPAKAGIQNGDEKLGPRSRGGERFFAADYRDGT
jgi:hypothetical protein